MVACLDRSWGALIFLLQLLMVAVPSASVCPHVPSNDPYPVASISACPLVLVCLEEHCLCVGGTLLASTATCVATGTTCDMATYCHRKLFSCLQETAAMSSNVSSRDHCEKWGFTATNALLQYAARPGNYTLTSTFKSCAAQLCEAINGTSGCETPNSVYACAFVPPAATGSSSAPVVATIYGLLSIPGDFALVSSDADVGAVRSAVSNDLVEAFPGTVVMSVRIEPLSTYSRSTTYDAALVVRFKVGLSTNSSAAVSTAKAALAALTTTSAWLMSTKTTLARIVPNARLGLPVLEYSTAPPVAAPTVTTPLCDSKCIAAVAVGSVVVVLIIILVYCFLKSEKRGQSGSSKVIELRE